MDSFGHAYWVAAEMHRCLGDEAAHVASEKAETYRLEGDESEAAYWNRVTEFAVHIGALKEPDGSIDLTWMVVDGAVQIVWKEHVKHVLNVAENRGFGSRLIKTAVASERESRTEMKFESDGLKCVIAFTPRT